MTGMSVSSKKSGSHFSISFPYWSNFLNEVILSFNDSTFPLCKIIHTILSSSKTIYVSPLLLLSKLKPNFAKDIQNKIWPLKTTLMMGASSSYHHRCNACAQFLLAELDKSISRNLCHQNIQPSDPSGYLRTTLHSCTNAPMHSGYLLTTADVFIQGEKFLKRLNPIWIWNKI